MNSTAVLLCINQLLTDIQLKNCLIATQITDLQLRRILNTAGTALGHCQLAILEYCQNNQLQ